MWEYKRTDIKFRTYSELIDILNKEGSEEWEIAYYVEEKPEKFGDDYISRVLFKRLKLPA
jgi:hypothetical protein